MPSSLVGSGVGTGAGVGVGTGVGTGADGTTVFVESPPQAESALAKTVTVRIFGTHQMWVTN
jgi:hypothetical protein